MKNHLSFDVDLYISNEKQYKVEITEDYEGDRFHCVVFEKNEDTYEYCQTVGFDSEKSVFNFLRVLQND